MFHKPCKPRTLSGRSSCSRSTACTRGQDNSNCPFCTIATAKYTNLPPASTNTHQQLHFSTCSLDLLLNLFSFHFHKFSQIWLTREMSWNSRMLSGWAYIWVTPIHIATSHGLSYVSSWSATAALFNGDTSRRHRTMRHSVVHSCKWLCYIDYVRVPIETMAEGGYMGRRRMYS